MSPGSSSGVGGEAAIALHRAAYALDAIRDRLIAFGAGFFETEVRARPYDDLERVGREMDALSEELTAALGGKHEAVVAFAGAAAAVHDIVGIVGRLKHPDASQDALTLAEETTEQLEDRRDVFDAGRDRFMQARRA